MFLQSLHPIKWKHSRLSSCPSIPSEGAAVMHFIDSSYSPPIREPRTNAGLNLIKATNLAWQGNAFEANLDRSTNQRSCREWKSLCSTSKLPRWRIQVKFPISRSRPLGRSRRIFASCSILRMICGSITRPRL